jgi:hypothetical protein
MVNEKLLEVFSKIYTQFIRKSCGAWCLRRDEQLWATIYDVENVKRQ